MAGAADLQEPITLQSRNGVLDILLVAKAAALPSLAPFSPTGWVYDICLNSHNGANDCPAKPGAPNLYGGTHLQLSPGDTLKIHLVNKLPPITDSSHAQDPDVAERALTVLRCLAKRGTVVKHGTSRDARWALVDKSADAKSIVDNCLR